MITEERVAELIEGHIADSELFLVEVKVNPGNLIKIHVDTPAGISIDECVKLSRFLNEAMDRDEEDYSLEVSSPGASGTFRVKQQYEKNIGREIEVVLMDGVKYTGKLVSISDQGIMMIVGGDDEEIEFEEIKKAKAIISF